MKKALLKKVAAAAAVVALIFGAMTTRSALADIDDIREDWTLGAVDELRSPFRETVPTDRVVYRARRRRRRGRNREPKD